MGDPQERKHSPAEEGSRIVDMAELGRKISTAFLGPMSDEIKLDEVLPSLIHLNSPSQAISAIPLSLDLTVTEQTFVTRFFRNVYNFAYRLSRKGPVTAEYQWMSSALIGVSRLQNLGDLRALTIEQIKAIDGMGPKSASLIVEAVKRFDPQSSVPEQM